MVTFPTSRVSVNAHRGVRHDVDILGHVRAVEVEGVEAGAFLEHRCRTAVARIPHERVVAAVAKRGGVVRRGRR